MEPARDDRVCAKSCVVTLAITLGALLVLIALAVGLPLLIVVFALAFVPAAVIFTWARRARDRPNGADVRIPDPLTLKVSFWRGFLFVIIPLVPELLLMYLLVPAVFGDLEHAPLGAYLAGQVVNAGITPGVVEELYKWWLTSLAITMHNGRSPQPPPLLASDIIVLAVFSALGFLTFEDLEYAVGSATTGGLVVAGLTIVLRILSFPLHLSFAAMSGKAIADRVQAGRHAWIVTPRGIWRQVGLHALYDYVLTVSIAPQVTDAWPYAPVLLVVPIAIVVWCAVYLWQTLHAITRVAIPPPDDVVVQVPR
ncbi:PrsW family intramembrane metalloprotease [Plasmodiophora brassicae]|uniref:Uncharacterized protein n=1 Tax=Plasmodiophora brassicae TaxID=37360 RepID=A0A3P3Y4W0_PLABS|nr:unnamed protein product [Plasmodiophora brassicae]